jgi:hypothetical protein
MPIEDFGDGGAASHSTDAGGTQPNGGSHLRHGSHPVVLPVHAPPAHSPPTMHCAASSHAAPSAAAAAQSDAQQSPSAALPSSHASPASSVPLPHVVQISSAQAASSPTSSLAVSVTSSVQVPAACSPANADNALDGRCSPPDVGGQGIVPSAWSERSRSKSSWPEHTWSITTTSVPSGLRSRNSRSPT